MTEKYIWRINETIVPNFGVAHLTHIYTAPADVEISGIKWDLNIYIMNVPTPTSGFLPDHHYFLAWALASTVTDAYKGAIQFTGLDGQFFLPPENMITGAFEAFTTQKSIKVIGGAIETPNDSELTSLNFLGEVNALPATMEQVLGASITNPTKDVLLEERQDTTDEYMIMRLKGRTPIRKKLRKNQALYLHFKTNWTTAIHLVNVLGIIQHNAKVL